MNLLEAHARFLLREDRDILPIPVTTGGIDCWPAFAAALADLSGQLQDAETNEDLEAAIEHGKTLLSAEVISPKEVIQQTEVVLAVLMKWGERHVRMIEEN